MYVIWDGTSQHRNTSLEHVCSTLSDLEPEVQEETGRLSSLSVWRWLSLRGNESMMQRHCSNSSPCVIAAKANSGLGERILPLNQQIVCVFAGSKETFLELWKGRNLWSSSFQPNPLLVKPVTWLFEQPLIFPWVLLFLKLSVSAFSFKCSLARWGRFLDLNP